jgi:hypothetical protein
MTTNEEAAEVLERAADGFESGRYGWIKGCATRRIGQDVSYCSVGALYYESGLYDCLLGSDAANRKYRKAEHALAEVVGAISVRDESGFVIATEIPAWNDYVAAGVGEVIDAMKTAAKNLRNEE